MKQSINPIDHLAIIGVFEIGFLVQNYDFCRKPPDLFSIVVVGGLCFPTKLIHSIVQMVVTGRRSLHVVTLFKTGTRYQGIIVVSVSLEEGLS